jgi:hypothetical protein
MWPRLNIRNIIERILFRQISSLRLTILAFDFERVADVGVGQVENSAD